MSTPISKVLGGKNGSIKRDILSLCVEKGDLSIADLSREICLSIPTTTKLIGELIEDGYLEDRGKLGTSGGRKPSIFGIRAGAGYFIGVDVHRDSIGIAVTDFTGKVIDCSDGIAFTLESTADKFIELGKLVQKKIKKCTVDKDDVLAYGFNFTGRVNFETGYSFTYDLGDDVRVDKLLEENLGAPVFIENDSRAMTYGEFTNGCAQQADNVLLFNVSWGLGMGIILHRELFYGKSGFSGEIGHFSMLNNDQICQCGKTGCLETGASGLALRRIVIEKIKEGRASSLSDKYASDGDLSLEDILNAIREGDVLAIESIGEVGETLGRAIAGSINIFNPDMIVIGGLLSEAKDYLVLPVKSSINKYSLKLVSNDTVVKTSRLGKRGGAIGACTLSRSRLLGRF